MRLNAYTKMLENIYGKSVVNQLTSRSKENQTLSLIDNKNEINRFIKSFKRINGIGCQNCITKIDELTNKPIFRKDYTTRIMDFPSWYPDNPLNFKNNHHAKEIMIIGEAPSPKIQRQINIAFELGRYSINSDGTIDLSKEDDKGIIKQVQYNNLWKYLSQLFSNKLNYVKKNCYITDICKCNDDLLEIKNGRKYVSKNRKIWDNCINEYLLNEITLLNPKLIIFQGNTAYEYLKNLFTFKEDDLGEKYNFSKKEYVEKFLDKNYTELTKKDLRRIPKTFPKFGTIVFENNKMISFIKIFHTARTSTYWTKNNNQKTIYFEKYIELFQEKVFPLLNLI